MVKNENDKKSINKVSSSSDNEIVQTNHTDHNELNNISSKHDIQFQLEVECEVNSLKSHSNSINSNKSFSNSDNLNTLSPEILLHLKNLELTIPGGKRKRGKRMSRRVSHVHRQSAYEMKQTHPYKLNETLAQVLKIKDKGLPGWIIDNYEYLSLVEETHEFTQIMTDKLALLEIKRSRFIFKEEGRFSIYWNIIVSLVLMVILVCFPFEMSEQDLESNKIQFSINMAFEQVFIVDIVINFFTAQQDEFGVQILDHKDICINQLKYWFLIDFMSSFPTNNMMYWGIINVSVMSKNNQVKLIKIPKQVRYINVIKKMGSLNFTTIFAEMVDQFGLYQTMLKVAKLLQTVIVFLLFSFILSAQMVSYVTPCNQDGHKRTNWFKFAIADEYQFIIYQPEHRLQEKVMEIEAQNIEDSNPEMAANRFYCQLIKDKRQYVQVQAFQFVIQTVTTVGQGDIESSGADEKLFRIFCMIFGVVLFSVLSSSVLENLIIDSFNDEEIQMRRQKVELVIDKQELKAEARKAISQLGEGLHRTPLIEELNFIEKLPQHMSEIVIKAIQHVQINKMPMLQGESIELFLELQKLSHQRRSIQNEKIVETMDEVSVDNPARFQLIQMGKVGVTISLMSYITTNEQFKQLSIGDEFCWSLMLHGLNYQFTQICTQDVELLEVNQQEFVKLMFQKSLKVSSWFFRKLHETLTDMYMILCLMYLKMKEGSYIEKTQFNSVASILKIKEYDYLVFNKVQRVSRDINTQVNDLENFRWFYDQIDEDILKQVNGRITTLLPKLISPDILKIIKKDKIKKL